MAATGHARGQGVTGRSVAPRGAARLVGRETELRVLNDLVGAMASEDRRGVAVVGEPGIGKTRLLAELSAMARSAGLGVITGRGHELEPAIPFGLAVDALDHPLAGLDAATLTSLPSDQLAELAALLPSVRDAISRPMARASGDPSRCHEAVRSALSRLARHRRTLLVLDDLHWADAASVELILHLMLRGVPRAAIALAYRPHLMAGRLLARMQAATRQGGLRTLDLAPLSAADAAKMIGDRVDPVEASALHAESGGIPLYLEQIATRLSDSMRSPPPGRPILVDAGKEVPSVVRAAVAAEVLALTPAARQLARAAAVAGDPFTLQLAAAVADAPPLLAADALRELLDADLIRPGEAADEFAFRRPIIRTAVYATAGPGWRIAAHERAARALAAGDAPLSVRARHVERCAQAADEGAIALLTEAGLSVSASAPADAARWFEAVLRLMPDAADSQRRLDVLIALAEALAAIGRLHRSRKVVQEVLDAVPETGTRMRRSVFAMMAHVEQGLGHGDVAQRLLDRALSEGDEDASTQVTFALRASCNALMDGRWQEAARLGSEARGLARAHGACTLALAATASLGRAAAYGGTVELAAEMLDESAARLDERPDAQVFGPLLDALANVVEGEIALDRLDRAGRHVERGLSVSRTTGHWQTLAQLVLADAATSILQGRLDRASRAADTAVRLALEMSNDQLLGGAEALASWCATLQGDVGAATAAGSRAAAAANRAPRSSHVWLARVCYGDALIHAGQIERGRQELLAAGGTTLRAVPPAMRALWYQPLVAADLAVGRIAAADRAARRCEAIAAAVELHSSKGAALLCRASVLLARNEGARSAIVAEGAARCYEGAGMALFAAQARLAGGRAHALAGTTAQAQDHLERACVAFDAFGAARLFDQAAKQLRTLGGRTPRARVNSPPSPGSAGRLSKRQREVAERVAQGYTNREIAGELSLSEKTVEKHLASVFGKLGVSSRTQVAATVALWDGLRGDLSASEGGSSETATS
ncbi:MAG: hypothetical protein V7607_1728 [Solirubrobacteraceae bacterium]